MSHAALDRDDVVPLHDAVELSDELGETCGLDLRAERRADWKEPEPGCPGYAHQGRVVDLGPDTVTFELTGTPEELDAFEELARPYGIKELVRTGRVGIARASARKATRLSAIN